MIFKGDAGDIRAVDDLTFSVEEGEIFGLVGPDGAGKTTCLRILCGLMTPAAGSAMVLGRNVSETPEAVRSDIGYMAQVAGLYGDLTVQENIEFYAELHRVSRGRYRERMERLLAFSGLSPFTGRLFRNLSGGMKQKVGLTCALIHTPKILLLDEPTNGVDPVSRRDFWKILYELQREKVTVVMATTYLDEADRCHRVALFDRGKARLVMSPVEMRGLLPGRFYQLHTRDRRRAVEVLRNTADVRNPAIMGPGVQFELDTKADPSSVETALRTAGIDHERPERVEPSLEAIYLSLLNTENHNG